MESKLAQARKRKYWTLSQAAEQIGVDANTLNRWELGKTKPRSYNMQRLCDVYGMTAVEMALLEEETTQTPISVYTPALITLPTSSDILARFRQQDFTLRLLRVASDCTFHDLTCQHIQGKVLQMLKDNSKNNDIKHILSRREAIWRLAAFPLELYGLAAVEAMPKQPPSESFIAHCAAGITACWHLSTNTDELASVTNIAASYIPTLTAIVESSSQSQYRQAAADVLVQCYLLQATYTRLIKGSNDAFMYIQTADQYSKVSGNTISRTLTLRTLASAHSYASNWNLALQSAEQARYTMEKSKTPMPPMVASFVYAGLANYQAYQGQRQEALTSLGKAHTTFFAQSNDEENAVCVDHDLSNLLLNDGMTHFHLGLSKKAHGSFQQLHALPTKSALIAAETALNQVMTEVYRSDIGRDMEYCITYWTQGVEGAKSTQSDQRFSEATLAYTAMRATWPGEPRIAELRELAVHW